MKNSRLILALAIALLPTMGLARPELCESAAAQAARETGVPPEVLLAITLVETGRQSGGRLRPWPWAANTEGRGQWFASQQEASQFARETLARGQNSIDLGCFQINWRWHGAQFTSPDALLDPLTSARYAARLLSDLYEELGTWERAAGAYHSRTPRFASRYRARFRQVLARNVDPAPPAVDLQVATAPRPAFPLFSGTARGASLVPVNLPATAPLFRITP